MYENNFNRYPYQPKIQRGPLGHPQGPLVRRDTIGRPIGPAIQRDTIGQPMGPILERDTIGQPKMPLGGIGRGPIRSADQLIQQIRNPLMK